jgi:hypothetical protein
MAIYFYHPRNLGKKAIDEVCAVIIRKCTCSLRHKNNFPNFRTALTKTISSFNYKMRTFHWQKVKKY